MKINKSSGYATEVLIAEDSPTQAEQLKYILENHDCKVIVAKDGKNALALAIENKPSLIISDIVMPEMNGFELCKELKSNESTAEIPVILLTSLTSIEDVLKGISCGADNFITKPYREEYLISHIEQILASKELYKSERVRFGAEIEISGKTHFITANQQQVFSLLISTYEAAVERNNELLQAQEELKAINDNLESIVEERTFDLAEEVKISNDIANRLKDSEERYRNLYDNAVVGLYRTNSQGKILMANKVLVKMLGFQSMEELETINLNESAKGSSFNRHEFIEKIEKNSEVRDLEAIWIRRDGKEIFVRESAKVIRDSDGKFLYFEGTVEDISDWKEAKDALTQSHMLNESLLKTIPFAMHIVDETGTVLYQSDIFTILFEEKGIGKKCWDLYNDKKKQPSDCPLIKGITLGETDTTVAYGVLGNRIFEISHTGMLYEGKKAMLEIFQDISDRKKIEKDLNEAKEKAEESDRLKSAFLANMSHEIRTPMNGILGFLDLLQEPNLDDKEKDKYVRIVNKSGQRLLDTINNIIEISRIEAGQIRIAKEEVVLKPFLNYYYDFFLPQIREKDLQLHLVRSNSTPDAIFTDRSRLDCILTNLIKNAIKFTNKGIIEVGCKPHDKEQLLFYVKDTGRGIKPDKINLIFDRFMQADISLTRGYEGSGLGLSITKAYVEAMGGSIWVESKPEDGSCFWFTIPLSNDKTGFVITS
jgi:two-component system sensor histidine kinase/response regulator